MGLTLLIILLILNLLNVFLHSFGSCVLIYLYNRSRQKAQQLYLIHLSISECLMNLLESIRIITKFVSLKGYMLHEIEMFRHYILIVSFTGVSFVFYIDMIYLTLDRLMVIMLNLKYTKYWNEKKAKYLLLVTWIIAFTIAVTVAITYSLFNFEWMPFFFKYFYPTIEFVFILLALSVYSFIFFKYQKSQKSVSFPLREPSERTMQVGTLRKIFNSKKYSIKNNKVSNFTKFKKSVFYIPILLITTFLMFITIPDLTYLFVAIINNNPSQILSTACWISYGVSNLLDAWIYIYLQHNVRNFMKKIFKIRRRGGSRKCETFVINYSNLTGGIALGKVTLQKYTNTITSIAQENHTVEPVLL